MKDYCFFKKIEEEKLFAVIRLDKSENCKECVSALIKGGVKIAELSFTMPYAHTVLQELTKEFGDKIILGAGTVLDAETARIAVLSGAKFIVCPVFNEQVIKTANRYGIPVISGFDGLSDIPKALELGVKAFKLFPAEHFGYKYIKDIKGPFPNAEIIAMGGVNADNIKEWLNGGALAVGVSGEICSLANAGDFDGVIKKAKKLKEAIK